MHLCLLFTKAPAPDFCQRTELRQFSPSVDEARVVKCEVSMDTIHQLYFHHIHAYAMYGEMSRRLLGRGQEVR